MRNVSVYVALAIAFVIIGTFQFFSLESKPSEQNNSTSNVIQQPRILAETSPLVKANLMNGGYHYDSIFRSGDQNHVLIHVVYQSNNHTSGPIVVTMDEPPTKIISVEIQKPIQYG